MASRFTGRAVRRTFLQCVLFARMLPQASGPCRRCPYAVAPKLSAPLQCGLSNRQRTRSRSSCIAFRHRSNGPDDSAGTFAKAKQLQVNTMLYTIAVVLLLLWVLGLASSYTLGGFIHILIVVAIVMVLVNLITGRRTL